MQEALGSIMIQLAWTKALISAWSEGAVWETSFATFRADKALKILTVIEVKRPDIIDRELAKIRAKFGALGWTVKEIEEKTVEGE